MGKLNEKRFELNNPYPVKKNEIIDIIERSTRLVHTATDDKTIQLYIYSNGSERPEAFAEVEITSVGYILHGAEGYDYQGNSLKELENDLKDIVFHFDAITSKRFGENKEQLFDSILNEAINPRSVGGARGSRWFNWNGYIKSPEPVYYYLGVVHEVDADYYVDKYGETTECRFAAVKFDTKEEAIDAAKKAMIFDGTPDYEKVDIKFKKVNESDETYKAKVTGKGWLKGQGFTDKKQMLMSLSQKQNLHSINQMKKDGKLNKNAKPSVVKESLQFFESKESLFNYLLEAVEDFPRSTRAMYRFAKRRHDDTGAIRKVSKQPYWVHPEGVAKIVMEHGGSDLEIKAAMAHDVLEDTGESYEDMVEKFGDKVASIVKEVTNDKDEITKVGKEKYISEELCCLSPEALTVKLADMLYNMKDSPTEKNYERMRKNIAFLMMNRQLSGKHLELAQEIMEV